LPDCSNSIVQSTVSARTSLDGAQSGGPPRRQIDGCALTPDPTQSANDIVRCREAGGDSASLALEPAT
jgi:hypothetical protein